MDVSRAGRIALLVLGPVLCPAAFADFPAAFATPEEAAQANERTVGLQLERDARHFDLLDDIQASLGLAAGLRLVPVIGPNHVQNVYDLLYLDGVDLALVRTDSIEYVRRVAGLAGAERLVRSVARIGGERIVVVAGGAITRIGQLEGRPVGFGTAGSGEFVTGTLVFDALGIDARPVAAAGADALERVRSGELAAMVHLLGASEAFGPGDGRAIDGVRVLALPADGALSALYRPATLDAADLPGLIDDGARVSTRSVDVNLVAYAWRAEHARAQRVERVAEALVDRFEALHGDPSEPEWRDVSLRADTPNVAGAAMVERVLARRAETKARLAADRARAERVPEVGVWAPRDPPRIGDAVATDGRTDAMEWLFGGVDALLAPRDSAAATASSAAARGPGDVDG